MGLALGRVAQILSDVVNRSADEGDLAHRLVAACARSIPGTDVGLVLMVDDGPAGVVAVTDGLPASMEDLQFTLGEGPCLDSFRTGRPVLLPDLSAVGSSRWPAFSAGALDAGVRGVFAFPLRVGAIRLGVLDLYRDVSGGLSMGELREALSFADAATAVLLHLQSRVGADGDGGSIAMVDNRAEVHQATGFIAETAGVSMPSALVLLRARAYASGRPIADLAKDVLMSVVQFTTDEAGIHGR